MVGLRRVSPIFHSMQRVRGGLWQTGPKLKLKLRLVPPEHFGCHCAHRGRSSHPTFAVPSSVDGGGGAGPLRQPQTCRARTQRCALAAVRTVRGVGIFVPFLIAVLVGCLLTPPPLLLGRPVGLCCAVDSLLKKESLLRVEPGGMAGRGNSPPKGDTPPEKLNPPREIVSLFFIFKLSLSFFF